MNRIYLPAIVFLILPLIMGCSSTVTRNPVVPSEKIAGDSTSSHQLWGLWQFVADPDAGTLDVIHLRDADLHLNALKFLEPPVNTYLALEGPLQFNGNILDVDIGLTHPFYGYPQYTGFDVCGIVITCGSVSGFSDPDVVMAGEGDTRLLNADGYSRWWNPVEYPAGNTIFNYIDGLLGTPHEVAQFNCTVNGYKYFCDNLEKDTEITELDPATEWGIFSAGLKNVRHYTIDLGGSFVFNYAVDANWQKPISGPPYVPPDCFPPEAWRLEAWYVSITEIENTLWNIGEYNGGGLSLLVDVWDHFDAELNTVLAESPGSFEPVSSDTPIDGGLGYSTYIIDITDATPAPGEINILVTVEAPVGVESVCAYFTYAATVAAEAPVCEGVDETEPNGSCSEADALTVDTPMWGCVREESDLWDFWEFEITTAGNYDIFLFNESDGDIDLRLYNADCQLLAGSGNHGAGEDEWIEEIGLTPGIYYAAVEADNASGPYAGERHYRLLVEYNPGPTEPFVAVAYYDKDNGDLKYAWKELYTNPPWFREIVDGEGDVGTSPQLVSDSSGIPHIYYMDKTNAQLKQAYKSGGSWHTEAFPELDIEVLEDVALDSDDKPHIVYASPGFGSLEYGLHDGSSWETTTILSFWPGTASSIAVDSLDQPHIAFDDDESAGVLAHAWFNGVEWIYEEVFSGPGFPAVGVSIDLDSNDYSHIAHCQNYSPLMLYHSYYDGVEWHTEELTSPGYQPDLEIGPSNTIHIAYLNGLAESNTGIYYGYFDGVEWSFETTFCSIEAVKKPSLAIDPSNIAHITYYRTQLKKLKWIRDIGPGWVHGTVDQDGDVGSYNSIEIIGK